MKKIKEQKENLTEGLMDIIWKKLMSGKKAGLINAFDHNPEVKKEIEGVATALGDLKKSLEKYNKKQGR